MRHSCRRSVPAILVLASLATSIARAQAPAEPEPAPANYVVHEWGTFTSMVGGDGVVLDGLHHEEEALPGFVHDLLKVDEYARDDRFKLPASHVTQKMETPVIYFYADEPLRVAASVAFFQGLMTQFYPLPESVAPDLATARRQRIDMQQVVWSNLVWDVDVIPRSQPVPAEIPAVADDDPWGYARMTGASFVRTRPGAGSPARPEAEHYLFYRGLGRWQPEVALACDADTATFRNGMPQAIPFALALELGERGGRFAVGRPLAPGEQIAFDLGRAPFEPDRERFARTVGAVVMKALVDGGLFLDEARAMVATWSRSWFQKAGARVVYLLPRAQVDQVLHLSLSPRPKELVRVLVGRLEFITPAAQARVERALLERDSAEADVAAGAARVLAGLDRFLEPHLRNVERCGTSDAVRRAAAAMLAATTR